MYNSIDKNNVMMGGQNNDINMIYAQEEHYNPHWDMSSIQKL